MNSSHFIRGTSFFVILLLAIMINDRLSVVSACDLDQAHNGCRIDNGACSCSYGCKSEFRYASLKECTDALKGRSSDLCSREPCLHRGVCIQITQNPGYRCRCEGTGYYGNRCQRKCPDASENHLIHQYPYECIVI